MFDWLAKLLGFPVDPPDYLQVPCPRCGYGYGRYSHAATYDEVADVLKVHCFRCDARWDMPPMKRKEAKDV